jgi:hypothetical protein
LEGRWDESETEHIKELPREKDAGTVREDETQKELEEEGLNYKLSDWDGGTFCQKDGRDIHLKTKAKTH